MTPKNRMQAGAAVVGVAAAAAMGALTIVGGTARSAEVATINAPQAPAMTPAMTLGETITTPTTTTSILSFRPSVTAQPPPSAEPGG